MLKKTKSALAFCGHWAGRAETPHESCVLCYFAGSVLLLGYFLLPAVRGRQLLTLTGRLWSMGAGYGRYRANELMLLNSQTVTVQRKQHNI